MSKKVNLKPRAIMYPSPAVIASAYDEDGKADSCTLAFATMCSHHPPAVMIAINSTAKRKTLKSILEMKEFVVVRICNKADGTVACPVSSFENEVDANKEFYRRATEEMLIVPEYVQQELAL